MLLPMHLFKGRHPRFHGEWDVYDLVPSIPGEQASAPWPRGLPVHLCIEVIARMVAEAPRLRPAPVRTALQGRPGRRQSMNMLAPPSIGVTLSSIRARLEVITDDGRDHVRPRSVL